MDFLLAALKGLGIPLAFAATTLAAAWVVFSGPGEPWNVILGIGCVLVGGFLCFQFWLFMMDGDTEGIGSLVAGLAAAVLVIAGLIGANQWLLHERGHDVACRVTAVTDKHGDDSAWVEYALACDGGRPTLITNTGRYSDVEKGGRVVVRYDPVGNAVPVRSSEVSDGYTALKIAAAGLGVLLLLGLLTALNS